MNSLICKICKNESSFLFTKLVLNKYQVKYYQCKNCEFIQVEEPYWISEAYQHVITKLDIGLVSRNILYLNRLAPKIKQYSKNNNQSIFLDYGGGYGLFTRMMRDKGLNFYRQDDYCENIFAESFDYNDLNPPLKFDLLTTFEVFEHLINPLEEIDKMLLHSDNIIFSTELQPTNQSIPDWWYIAPETGQHISFYSSKTLKVIAKIKDKKLFSDGKYLHMFADHNFKKDMTIEPISSLIHRAWNKLYFNSLLQYDFESIKNKLRNQ